MHLDLLLLYGRKRIVRLKWLWFSPFCVKVMSAAGSSGGTMCRTLKEHAEPLKNAPCLSDGSLCSYWSYGLLPWMPRNRPDVSRCKNSTRLVMPVTSEIRSLSNILWVFIRRCRLKMRLRLANKKWSVHHALSTSWRKPLSRGMF